MGTITLALGILSILTFTSATHTFIVLDIKEPTTEIRGWYASIFKRESSCRA
jgi:hypothetical protein